MAQRIRRRFLIWSGIAVCLARATLANAEPFTPTNDDLVLERLPTMPQVAALRAQRAALAQEPKNLDLALELALAYVRLGRSEADPRYDGYAEAALAPWWDLDQPPSPVLILRATLAQRRHAFATALADLEQVLGNAPGHPQALLTKATILAVQGERQSALASCRSLPLGVAAVVRAACSAAAAAGLAEGERSRRMLQRALALEPTAPTIRLWALTILAEGEAMQGDHGAAEAHFQAALAEGPHDAYLLGAHADLLLDQGRAGEALRLLESSTRIDPLLLRLALAERQLDGEDLGAHVDLLQARFATAGRRGDAVHLREQARFTLHLLDQPVAALDLALDNWAVQREPWDARLVLEAALAAGEPEAARPVVQWLEQVGLEDARLDPLLRAFGEAVS